ncbi:MAG TPA: hypothetical protein VIU12_25455 [Chryseolinea sp.]
MSNKTSTLNIPSESLEGHVSLATSKSRYVRYFFVGMACLFPVLVVLGFTPSYRDFSNGSFKPHWFVHVHGALMAGWLFIFLTQTFLAARDNLKYHRQLGMFSVFYGAIICLLMPTTSIRARIAFPSPVEDFLWNILAVELCAFGMFTLFFVWGILVRKNAAAHKRLLLMATLVLMGAAIDRMRWLPRFENGLFSNFAYLDALLIPLFVYDYFSVGRIHKITLLGSACLVTAQLLVGAVWESPAWHRFWFNRFAPFVEQVVEIKLSDAQTDPLLGDYGDKNWHMTLGRDDGGKLYLKLPDQPSLEVGAISANELFLKTATWKLSFERDADGRVTKIINTQAATTWEAARLP